MTSSRTKRLRRIALLAAVACLIGGVGVAVALGGEEAPSVVGTESKAAPEVAPVDGVPDTARDVLAVFRQPATADDAVDATLMQKMKLTGADPGLARSVSRSDSPSSQLYVVPGPNGSVCLIDGTGSGGCQLAEKVATEGMIGTNECPAGAGRQTMLLYGVVPDGVESVALTAPDGSKTSVKVVRNAWTQEIARNPSDARPTTASWTAESGASSRVQVPYSPDVDQPCN